MAKKKRKEYLRNEFVIDPEADSDLAEYVRNLKTKEDLSSYIRKLLRRSMGGDENAQSDTRLVAEIQDLRQMMLAFDERLEGLELVQRHEEEIKHLWSEMGRMNERLESLRASGTVDDDALTTPLSDDAKRQAALSAKLKRINFGGLTH
jgi:hypothetical protein